MLISASSFWILFAEAVMDVADDHGLELPAPAPALMLSITCLFWIEG